MDDPVAVIVRASHALIITHQPTTREHLMNTAIKLLSALGFSVTLFLVPSQLSAATTPPDLNCYKHVKCEIPEGGIYGIPKGGMLEPDPNPIVDQSPTATYAPWQCSLEPYVRNPHSKVVAWRATGRRVLTDPPGVPDNTADAKDRRRKTDKPCCVFFSYVDTPGDGWRFVPTSEIGPDYRLTGKECKKGDL